MTALGLRDRGADARRDRLDERRDRRSCTAGPGESRDTSTHRARRRSDDRHADRAVTSRPCVKALVELGSHLRAHFALRHLRHEHRLRRTRRHRARTAVRRDRRIAASRRCAHLRHRIAVRRTRPTATIRRPRAGYTIAASPSVGTRRAAPAALVRPRSASTVVHRDRVSSSSDAARRRRRRAPAADVGARASLGHPLHRGALGLEARRARRRRSRSPRRPSPRRAAPLRTHRYAVW